MRKLLLIFWLAMLALVQAEPATKGSLVLGAVYNTQGAQASLDNPSLEGAKLAVAHINERGGVRGRKLQLVVEEADSTPAGVAAASARCLKHKPLAVFGLSDTDMVLKAAPVVTRQGVAFLTSGATSPRLPSEVPGLYLGCFGDNVQAAAAAEYLYKVQGVRSVALMWDEEMEYTRLLSAYFRDRFRQLGGHIDTQQKFRGGQLSNPQGKEADAVFLAAGPDHVVSLVKYLRSQGFQQPIMGGDAYDGLAIEDENVFYTTHAVQPKLQGYPGQPDAFSALGYDAVSLLADALRRSASLTPAGVKRALGETRKFKGLTGTIAYVNGSRVPLKSVAIAKGGGELIRMWNPTKVPAI